MICTFNELDDDAEHVDVTGEWCAPGTPSALGRHRLADWGPARLPDLLSGRPEWIEDVATDPRTAGSIAESSYAALGCRASLNVAFVRDGHVRAMLAVGAAEPRRWSDSEMQLAQDTVERTWEAAERVRAEAALRESETHHRKILEMETVAIVHFDLIGGITDANDTFLRLIGYTREELETGKVRYESLTPPDWTWRDRQTIAELGEAGQSGPFEKQYFRRDASRLWILCASRMLDARTAVEFIVDVTERKTTEALLRESEARLRLVQAAGGIGSFDYDLQKDDAICSPEYYTILGLPDGHPINRETWSAALHPDDRHKAIDALNQAIEDRRPFDYEYRIVRASDGEVRWLSGRAAIIFDSDDKPWRYVGGNIDITHRRTAEEQLRELNQTLEARVAERTVELERTWRLSQDLLVVAAPDGRLAAVNQAWTTMLGWESRELVGRTFMEFAHPDDLQATLAVFRSIFETPLIDPYEYRFRHKDGDYRWIAWTAAYENGQVFANGRDVTESRARQAELAAAQEQLRQSQKMEAMGSLTGGVAHDFNNLLTPIVGALDMLQRKGVGGEREQRLIAGAIQSADRAKVLVQRLLAFARRQPLQSKAVDVAELTRGIAELVASTAGPQVKVVIDAAQGLPPAKADPNQLEMVILNLALNARDAMWEGGTLRISVDVETVERQHRANLAPGRYLRLSVADTGTGMDEETLSRAVEPFFSTKGIGKGTGLGLSMVHGLASQLGGALTILSTRGVGTNVELWLPQSAEPPLRSESLDDAAPVAIRNGTALLVDDEELVRLSTADMLAELGYAVVEASSAEEALRLIERGLQPDLLVTDHLMPGMSGTELARMMRNGRLPMKILVVSGFADAEGIAPDLPRLTKPFRSIDLAGALAELVQSAGD